MNGNFANTITALALRFVAINNRRSQRDGLFTALGSSLWGALPIYSFYHYNITDAAYLYSTMPLYISVFCFLTLGSLYLMRRNILTGHSSNIFVFVQLPISVASLGIGLIFSFASLYKIFGVMDRGTKTTLPDACLYFSIVTWTTLGYGDVVPTEASRMIAASEALVGYIFMAILISSFGYILNRIIRNKSICSGTDHGTLAK
jgi:hypothetical protein